MRYRTIAYRSCVAALMLACVVGPANARHSNVGGRPDGKTGRASTTFNATTGTYRAWSNTGGHRGAVTVYPKSIESKPPKPSGAGGSDGHRMSGLEGLAQ